MICRSCGAEVTPGRRFCPKCGLPMTDYAVRPKEEEEDDVVSISKRIRGLRPIVEAEEKERERKKEEERKKREEELRKLEEEERKKYEEEEEEYLCGYEEDEEDEEDADEEELTTSSYDDSAESCEEEILVTGSDTEPKYAPVEEGMISVTTAVEEAYALSGSDVKVTGLVCFVDICEDYASFNIEDEDESLSCRVELIGLDCVNYGDLVYTKEDIINIVSSLKRGQKLIVEGTMSIKDNGDPELKLLSIDGDDFYIRCHE